MPDKIDKSIFHKIIEPLYKANEEELDYLYEIYDASIDSIVSLRDNNVLNNVNLIHHNELIFYILGEYVYTISRLNNEQKKEFIKNEKFQGQIASIATDKYLSLTSYKYQEKVLANRFLPSVSTLDLYLNFMLNILQNYKKNDPRNTLITDLLTKSISIARCITSLLVNGYETEAFSSWRTLHECECTLIVLASHNQEIIDVYLKHMKYGMVYKKGHSDTPQEQALFEKMKEEMKTLNLKSKDMKKYIEYGWMLSLDEAQKDPEFKLNFRDGLEKIAGLSQYNARYENSSEIIHSTPLLIYSSKEYYYYLTLLSVYESFFRLEKVFVVLYSMNVDDETLNRYNSLKRVYYTQLVTLHNIESQKFKNWQTNRINKKAVQQ